MTRMAANRLVFLYANMLESTEGSKLKSHPAFKDYHDLEYRYFSGSCGYGFESYS